MRGKGRNGGRFRFEVLAVATISVVTLLVFLRFVFPSQSAPEKQIVLGDKEVRKKNSLVLLLKP